MFITNERDVLTDELLAGIPHSLLLSNSNGERSRSKIDPTKYQVISEDEKKARELDMKYNQTAPGAVGPIEETLKDLGIVTGVAFGPFCDASVSLENLTRSLVELAAPRIQAECGFSSIKVARGFALNRYRRALSVACVKAHAHYVTNVVNRENPVRLQAARYSEFRERDLQNERDNYRGKHAPLRVAFDED